MTDNEETGRELRTLEERLLTQPVRASHHELTTLLAPEFVEIGASGVRHSRDFILDTLPVEPAAQRTLSDFEHRTLAPGLVQVFYRTRWHRAGEPDRHALRTSIWERRYDGWQMLYHQGTPIHTE
ncbi:DUF4440 domain-containing protein [Roseiterribacter gracilis]|uniref:DUF4440 domain-containing protein n=1 Tax=Roseiterribacter gracilis TaxID=2812848 RepID=A0A8S8X788_9PROT|nr:hypothetical protein TMPK1_12400 [Rhodospirillales bacterium TMPK1]